TPKKNHAARPARIEVTGPGPNRGLIAAYSHTSAIPNTMEKTARYASIIADSDGAGLPAAWRAAGISSPTDHSSATASVTKKTSPATKPASTTRLLLMVPIDVSMRLPAIPYPAFDAKSCTASSFAVLHRSVESRAPSHHHG